MMNLLKNVLHIAHETTMTTYFKHLIPAFLILCIQTGSVFGHDFILPQEGVISHKIRVAHTEYKHPLKMYNNVFKEAVTFTDCIFDSTFEINHHCLFEKQVTFLRCKFKQDGFFAESEFKDSLIIQNCDFQLATYFDHSIFQSLMSLRYSTFRNYVGCDSTFFQKELDFFSTSYGHGIGFFHARILDGIDFGAADFSRMIDLTTIISGSKECPINLFGATGQEYILMSYENFKLKFSSAVLNVEEKIPLYQNLLKCQENFGFSDGYKKMDIEYRKMKHGILFYPDYLWWECGYSKFRVVLYSIGFIIFFTFLIFRKYAMYLKTYPIESLLPDHGTKKSTSHNLFLCLVFVSILFFGLKIEINKLNFHHKPESRMILLIYLSGLICSAYLFHAVFTLKG
jgi:hypothetical protein